MDRVQQGVHGLSINVGSAKDGNCWWAGKVQGLVAMDSTMDGNGCAGMSWRSWRLGGEFPLRPLPLVNLSFLRQQSRSFLRRTPSAPSLEHPMLTVTHHLLGEDLVLHPHRALYWPRLQWLLVSDLHLGKAAHFRRAGAALPGHDDRVLQRLEGLVTVFRPERLVVLGDLFHSVHNHRWAPFAAWVKQLGIPVELVPGNHDILATATTARRGPARRYRGGRSLRVHPRAMERPGCYVIAGTCTRRAAQRAGGRACASCFLLRSPAGLLPAFGMATGLHLQRPCRGPHLRRDRARRAGRERAAGSRGKGPTLSVR